MSLLMSLSASTSAIALPKMGLARGIPYSSRKRNPISLGVMPSLASPTINEDTFSWLSVSQGGTSFEVGRVEWDLP
jgi:hypothetical protein